MRTETEHPSGLRTQNRTAVLACLHQFGAMSRKQLAVRLGLTPAAMTKISAELIAEDLIAETGSVGTGSVGRREILLSLNPDARFALGVWLGLGKAILSSVLLNGDVVFSETVSLPLRADAESAVSLLSDRLMQLVEQHHIPKKRIVGIGIAVRGVLGPDARTVKSSFDALNASDFPICARFEARTGYKSVLSNNVRALCAAQMFLSREPQSGSSFFVRCGTGIGGALSVGGRILAGSRGQCAEIGHIPVLLRGGKPCHCGKSGCLETVASPTAVREDAQLILSETETPLLWRLSGGRKEAVTTELVLDSARGGDTGAEAIANRAIEALADALKHVIYLIDPDRIVLYGTIFEHPYYLSRLKAEMDLGVDAAHAVPMEKSRFNNELENKAAGLLAVVQLMKNGGVSL